MKRWTGVALGLLLSGCVVMQSTYDAEVAHRTEVEEELALSSLRAIQLEQNIADLKKTEETLKLERSSLGEERVELMNSIEDLRIGNAGLEKELETEKQTRQRREAEIAEMSGTYQSLVDGLESELESGQVEIQRLKGQLQVRAVDKILFDSGSAKIKPAGRSVLAKLAGEFKNLKGYKIRVDGHTDNVPIATAAFPSNWELSATRASRVVRYLVDQGVDPGVLSATGYADNRPLVENDSAKNRSRNRRIELLLIPETGE